MLHLMYLILAPQVTWLWMYTFVISMSYLFMQATWGEDTSVRLGVAVTVTSGKRPRVKIHDWLWLSLIREEGWMQGSGSKSNKVDEYGGCSTVLSLGLARFHLSFKHIKWNEWKGQRSEGYYGFHYFHMRHYMTLVLYLGQWKVLKKYMPSLSSLCFN